MHFPTGLCLVLKRWLIDVKTGVLISNNPTANDWMILMTHRFLNGSWYMLLIKMEKLKYVANFASAILILKMTCPI